MNGRMFFIAMRTVEVPRRFDARLYSRSRMMTTCVLMKYAIPYPTGDRHCENHRPEARGEQHNKNGNQQNVRNIADNVVDNHHDGIDFFGETPKCADGDADSHVDKCADKCEGERIAAPCQIASKVDWPAPPVPRMVCRLKAPFVDRLCGTQMQLRLSRARFAYASYPEKIG